MTIAFQRVTKGGVQGSFRPGLHGDPGASDESFLHALVTLVEGKRRLLYANVPDKDIHSEAWVTASRHEP